MPLKSSTNLIHMCDIFKFNSINSISTYDNYSLYLTKNFVFNIIKFKLKWGEGGEGVKRKTFWFYHVIVIQYKPFRISWQVAQLHVKVLCTLYLSDKLTTWGALSDVTVETEVPRTCWGGTIVIPAQRSLAPNKGLYFVALHLQWWRFIMNEISSCRTDVRQYSINQLSCHFEHLFVFI